MYQLPWNKWLHMVILHHHHHHHHYTWLAMCACVRENLQRGMLAFLHVLPHTHTVCVMSHTVSHHTPLPPSCTLPHLNTAPPACHPTCMLPHPHVVPPTHPSNTCHDACPPMLCPSHMPTLCFQMVPVAKIQKKSGWTIV